MSAIRLPVGIQHADGSIVPVGEVKITQVHQPDCPHYEGDRESSHHRSSTIGASKAYSRGYDNIDWGKKGPVGQA